MIDLLYVWTTLVLVFLSGLTVRTALLSRSTRCTACGTVGKFSEFTRAQIAPHRAGDKGNLFGHWDICPLCETEARMTGGKVYPALGRRVLEREKVLKEISS